MEETKKESIIDFLLTNLRQEINDWFKLQIFKGELIESTDENGERIYEFAPIPGNSEFEDAHSNISNHLLAADSLFKYAKDQARDTVWR